QKVKEIGEAIASMLGKVGINAKLQTPDQNTGFAAIQQGKAPMYVFGRGDVIDPSEYLEQYFMTGVTKRLGYSNPDVDKALAAQQAASDPNERLNLLRQVMSLLMDEAPVAWLFQYQGVEGVSNRFDYTPNPGESVYAWDFQPKAQ
ncbi:MAG: peptide ABC transporter substrate-binding protein, partial [Chloroflexota bacterium]